MTPLPRRASISIHHLYLSRPCKYTLPDTSSLRILVTRFAMRVAGSSRVVLALQVLADTLQHLAIFTQGRWVIDRDAE